MVARHQFFTNDKAFVITGSSLEYLTCFFNSSLFKFAFKDYFPELLGDTRELRKVFFDTIPVKSTTDEDWFKKILQSIVADREQGISTHELENQLDEKLYDLYELTAAERAVIASSLGVAAPSLESMSAISASVSE